MSRYYWYKETPVEVKTEKNVVRYFKEAGKLQVSKTDWVDNGETKQGKTVTLDITSLLSSSDKDNAKKILEDILSKL